MKIKLIISLIISLCLTSFAFAKQNFTYSTPQTYKNYGVDRVNDTRERVLFIVDFSNSMNERLGSSTKLKTAISVMQDILQNIPQSTSVGLRVYGHRTGFTPRQSCSASDLLSPIQTENTANVYSKLKSIDAVGWTPITYSLKQAAFNDFGTDTETKKRIILISDGGENCDESPCDFIINLMKIRDDIRIDVIALAIGDDDANNQLKCVALVTSGKFYTANTASELKKSLEDSLNLQKEVQAEIVGR